MLNSKKIIFAALLFTTACTTPPLNVDKSLTNQFEEGKTTYNEVIAKLGKPNHESNQSFTSEPTTLICYSSMEISHNPAMMIPVFGLFFTGAKSEMKNICFTFNKELILVKKSYLESTSRVGLNAPD